jgi:hypothetical protein
MTKLKKTVVVDTPFAQAADLVEKFFIAATPENGSLALRLEARPFALAHDVIASFRRRKGSNQTIVFDLHWEAADKGPYPIFDGTLTVAQDETYERCRLILYGSYTPPGWLAGAAFDAVVGKRIALETAKELLERMSSFLTASYEETELSKRLAFKPAAASGSA